MLVTADELTAYMGGVQLTNEERDITESVILPGVQQDLELFLNRPVEPVQVRESLLVDEYGYTVLTVTPVWKIIKVQQSDGAVITGSSYVPPAMVDDPSTNRSVDYSGLGEYPLPFRYNVGSWGISAAWGGPATYVIVEYIAGYKGYTDKAIKLAILRVAAREVERQFDNSVTLVGGSVEAVQDSDSRIKGWTQEELNRFRRIRRRVIR